MHQANQAARNRLEDENMTLKEQLAQAEVRTRRQEAEVEQAMKDLQTAASEVLAENEKLRELLREMMYSPTRPPRLMARAEEALK
jgi:hypothetical protein